MNRQEKGHTMVSLEQQIKSLCKRHRITPDTNFKDQHFLVDEDVISNIANAADIKPKDFIVEIGPGLGHLTELLAQKARRVLAIEIDKKMRGPLEAVRLRRPNLQVVYRSVLDGEIPDCDKIVASLPFSIIEPLMRKLFRVRFKLATLVTGKKFAYEVQALPSEPNYGRLSALTQRRYEVRLVGEVSKESYWPTPRVNSAIINLNPFEQWKLKSQPVQFILGELVTQPDKKVKNALREATIRFEDLQGHKGTKRKARYTIEELELPQNILEEMSGKISNEDLQLIAAALME